MVTAAEESVADRAAAVAAARRREALLHRAVEVGIVARTQQEPHNPAMLAKLDDRMMLLLGGMRTVT